MIDFGKPEDTLRSKVYTVIFEADTRAGRIFDLALIYLIVISVLVVLFDSVDETHLFGHDLAGA